MTSRTQLTLIAIGAALLLAGCNFAPHYREPKTDASGSFKEAVPGAAADGQGWKLAEPSDASLRGDWWKMYRDKQLDDLEERVAISNQTVAAAEANYRAARAMADEARAALFPTVSADPSVIRSRSSAATASGGGGSSSGATTTTGTTGTSTGTTTGTTVSAQIAVDTNCTASRTRN